MPTALENVFYNNTSVTTNVGCTIEYNMNSMIEGVAVTTTSTDADYIAGVDTPSGTVLKANPYKKLFPIDSVIKPFRPLYPGVKYFILLGADNSANKFSPFRTLRYPGEGKNAYDANAEPRVYYPGVSTNYKYWVAPIGDAVNVTITYKQASNPVEGNKHALANKILVRFEKNHYLPANYSLVVTPETGSAVTYGPFNTSSSTSEYIHYYNGTNWNTRTLSEPVAYNAPQSIKSIKITTSAPPSDRVVGIIEFSARWIKDISSDIVSLDISKESSANSEDILPVGFITANSMNINLVKYNQTSLQYVEYNRTTSSLNPNITYVVKNAELKPHMKVYHSGATTVSGQYDKVPQGTYYVDNWSISEFGEVNLLSLDNAKYLMETIAPNIVCEDYPVTAILRQLLDSVGITNYNFNIITAGTGDTSIPTIRYWWTEDTVTVWECIQELCRDIQMNAIFDDEGILQFYSRDYLYSQTDASWNFHYEKSGSVLPNIVSLSRKEISSANQVKILWQSPVTSNYTGGATVLWQAPTSFLSAGGLKYTIEKDDTESDLNNLSNRGLQVETRTIDDYSQYQSVFNFSGYMMIGSEIFEFDAIQYQYDPKTNETSTPDWQLVWVESASDITKYKYLAKNGYADPNKPETAYFKPTGRLRVKSRAALGTATDLHTAAGPDSLTAWTGRTVTWKV